MSHNRKNIGRQFGTNYATAQENHDRDSRRRSVYIFALIAAFGLVLGLILSSTPAKAADGVESLIDQLHSKVVYLKSELTRSDEYADCLKRENRYLHQVLEGKKNYYAGPVCKR